MVLSSINTGGVILTPYFCCVGAKKDFIGILIHLKDIYERSIDIMAALQEEFCLMVIFSSLVSNKITVYNWFA